MRLRGLSLGLSHDNNRIFVGMFFNEAAFGIYRILWPLYIAALGATPPQIGFVVGFQALAKLFTLLPGGIVMERIPPRRLIVLARSATVVGMALVALGQTWWHLLPAAVVISLGTVGFPAISTTIAETARDNRDRTRSFTLIYTVGPSVSLVLAPALAGLIAELVGLRGVFVFTTALVLVAVVAFSRITPRPISRQDGPPVSYRTMLAQRPILMICLLQMATLFALTLGLTLAPNLLRDFRGVSVGMIGWLGSIAAVGSIILGVTIRRARLFQEPLPAIGLSVASTGAGLALLLLGQNMPAFLLAYLLTGGHFVAWTLFSAALGEVTPGPFRGRAFALAEILGGVGLSSAPFIAGWLYDREPTLPLIISVALVVPVLGGMVMIGRLIRQGAGATVLAGNQT